MKRISYFDYLRALLAYLGIPLHTLCFIMLDENDSMNSSAHAVVCSLFTWIHLFRMPAFYLIAGYFSLWLYRRKGMIQWLKDRWQRIAIPFIMFACLLIILRAILYLSAAKHHLLLHQSFFQYINYPSYYWFLYYLLLFYSLLVIVLIVRRYVLTYVQSYIFKIRNLENSSSVRTSSSSEGQQGAPTGDQDLFVGRRGADFPRRRNSNRKQSRSLAAESSKKNWLKYRTSIVILLLLIVNILSLLNYDFRDNFLPISYVPQLTYIIYYGSFFMVGCLLHGNTEVLKKEISEDCPRIEDTSEIKSDKKFGPWGANFLFWLKCHALWIFLCTMILYSAFLWASITIWPQVLSLMPHYLAWQKIYYLMLSWAWTGSLLALAMRYGQRTSKSIEYLAKTSYWIYLIHFPIVHICLPITMLITHSILLQAVITTIVAVALSLLSYRLIRHRLYFIAGYAAGVKKSC